MPYSLSLAGRGMGRGGSAAENTHRRRTASPNLSLKGEGSSPHSAASCTPGAYSLL